ncbi:MULTISPECIES: hypothetical protein [Sphingobacterium]|uniref:hypothetical protein n=1 Tax=Sphingobacterium TaxID=28453 RepID=UPI00257E4171|nr:MULTISPECIES: hypothetical protein [Sphingobacterium]
MEIDVNGIIATDDKNIVTISLPMTVIGEINKKAVSCTPLFKTKLYFLIWLINRGDRVIGQNSYYSNSYQLHVRAHKQVFTTKNELEKLTKFLIENQLIEVIGEYGTDSKKARTYRVIKGWELKNKSNELIHFDINIYTFAKHFQALKYLILPLSTKRPKPLAVKDVKPLGVVKYEELINKLIEENKELKEQIKSLIQSQPIVIEESKKEELSTATIEEYLQDDRDLIEEEIEIITESEPIVVEDKSKLRDRPYDRNTDYYRVISAYYSKTNDYDKEGLLCYAQRFRSLDKAILVEELNKVVVYEEYLKEYFKNYQKK